MVNVDELTAMLLLRAEGHRASRESQVQRVAQDASARELREMQDKEYQEALERDRLMLQEQAAAEREARQEEEKKRREEQAAKAEEEKRLAEIEARAREKAERLASLPEEPQPGPGVVSVSVRLPNSTRVTRRWQEETQMKTLFTWISACDLRPDGEEEELPSWLVCSHFPKVRHTDPERTLGSLGLGRNVLLFVEDATVACPTSPSAAPASAAAGPEGIESV